MLVNLGKSEVSPFFLSLSKFLIILAESSFENVPIFPWKTETVDHFHQDFQCVFKLYFWAKRVWRIWHQFWANFSKKIPKNRQFCQNFSKINLFWMSKWTGLLIFSKWTGLYWICQIFGNLENYRSDFGRKSSEKTEMISVKFDNLEEMSKWTRLFQ